MTLIDLALLGWFLNFVVAIVGTTFWIVDLVCRKYPNHIQMIPTHLRWMVLGNWIVTVLPFVVTVN